MNQKPIMEIVEFQTVTGTSQTDLVQGLEILKGFYEQQEGYIQMYPGIDKNGACRLFLLWESQCMEKSASQAMMASEETIVFKKLVNPKTFSKNIIDLI